MPFSYIYIYIRTVHYMGYNIMLVNINSSKYTLSLKHFFEEFYTVSFLYICIQTQCTTSNSKPLVLFSDRIIHLVQTFCGTFLVNIESLQPPEVPGERVIAASPGSQLEILTHIHPGEEGVGRMIKALPQCFPRYFITQQQIPIIQKPRRP